VERYRDFMDAVCRMVVGKYDGSLKAEHGTGRNMAPFVEMEWGRDGLLLMQRIKALFDPQGLLNPGVILNDDPQSHLKDLKPLPAGRPAGRQVHRVRLLRAQVPLARLTLSRRASASWAGARSRAWRPPAPCCMAPSARAP
jgi:D-lactate dehydrogenase